MRSTHLLALAAALTAATAACGGDDGDGNGPDNVAPTANFEPPTCTQLNCTFTDASTDSDGSIASRAWTFENGSPATSSQATQAVTFSAAGTWTVTLAVTDNEGGTDDFTREVTVTSGPPANQAPTASFDVDCSSEVCNFTNTSTDADGTIVSFAWNFGEPSSGANNTATTEDASHTYNVTDLTNFTVTLTVTDDDGATSTTTNDVAVAPPASLSCGSTPDCDLTLDAASKVTVTLVSSDCELHGNTFKVTITSPGQSPIEETLFTDGCFVTPGSQFQLQTAATFAAGTTITAQVISGGSSLALPPALRLAAGSAYPNWTLEFDDGAIGPDVDPNEPDFNDLVINIQAHP
jgi:PKD domain